MSAFNMKKKRPDAGMTLIEILVVLGLIMLIGGIAIIAGVDSYSRQLFRSDRDILISSLYRARALSISNTCFGPTCTTGLPHGVHIEPGKIVVFQGNTYDEDDDYNEATDISEITNIDGVIEVVFEPLSGSVSTSVDIVLNGSSGYSTTTVGTEGQIFWTR